MIKKILLVVFLLIIVGGVLYFAIDGSAKKENDYKTVPVERGGIVDKALAVGRIEPKKEISIKSKISGIVKKAYVEIGDEVERFALVLQVDELLDRSIVIAEVKPTGRLDARENSHEGAHPIAPGGCRQYPEASGGGLYLRG